MSLNVTESNAVNVLLDHVYGPLDRYGDGKLAPTAADVDEAARTLASSANRRLVAGWSELDVAGKTPLRDDGGEKARAWDAIDEALDNNTLGHLSAADVCAVGFARQARLQPVGKRHA
jgi:glutathione S-transferase